MSIIQLDAGDYFGSNESALLSLTYLNSRNENDFDCLSSNYNELAMSSSKLKNYDKSLEYYDLALRYLKNEMSKLIVLNNKALVYSEKKRL